MRRSKKTTTETLPGLTDRRIEVDRLEMGRAASRIGRAGEGTPADRLFFGEGAGHSYGGHAAAAAEGQLVREAYLSLLQGGLDQSRGAGIGTRGRTGGRGHTGRGTDRRKGPRGTRLAF